MMSLQVLWLVIKRPNTKPQNSVTKKRKKVGTLNFTVVLNHLMKNTDKLRGVKCVDVHTRKKKIHFSVFKQKSVDYHAFTSGPNLNTEK